MIAATVAVFEEGGVTRLTVTHVIHRARVSRKTFYDVFKDAEDCFLATFEDALQRAQQVASTAYAAERSWRAGMRAAVTVLLEMVEQEPGLAWMCVVGASGAGERVLERHTQAVHELAAAVERGREVSRTSKAPRDIAGEAATGGILALLHNRLLENDGQPPVVELTGPIMSTIVMPYLGRAAARQEFERPAPPPAPPRVESRVSSDPGVLRRLDLRLTYRTIRVLSAIGADPDATNRAVAEAAGIRDQGQISKLLKRLMHMKLIENVGEGQPKGMGNAWRLTKLGCEVLQSTRSSWRVETHID